MPVYVQCLIAVTLYLLVGCDYGHKQYRQNRDIMPPGTTPLVIEIDDYGRFWNPKAAEATLDAIAKASSQKNTVVLTFIHGWHHNASECDDNFQNFHNSLGQLQKRLDEPSYKEGRKRLKLKEEIQVIGLYVGWRGRSLPWLADYLTFWTRKSAAERVGDGDLREFLAKLQRLYLKYNEPPTSGDATFMGLVMVGHSFGGQVLFKAVSGALEKDLLDALSRGTRDPETNKIKLREIVSGFGDMTVLLNPAFEAFQYERIHRLTRNGTFISNQTPVLFTVSAEDDSARKYWFPYGRNLNLFFRPTFPDNEGKELWTTAFGEYVPQRTHDLEKTTQESDLDDSLYDKCDIQSVDFSARHILGDAELQPQGNPAQPNSPVVVAHTSSELVQQHNGIFGETFSEFLTEYIANVEAKRLCLIRNSRQNVTIR
nr:hypothetical protein [Nitrosomonas nitrosa]